MGEAVRMNEEQKKQWNSVREKAIKVLIADMPTTNENWQKAAITKGVSRLIDEKFNLASKKLEAIDKGAGYVVTMAKTASISDKEKLIAEILECNNSLFTKDMLKKLTVDDLNALKNRL